MSDETESLEPIPPFGHGAMAALDRNAIRLEARERARFAAMAQRIADYLKTRASQGSEKDATP